MLLDEKESVFVIAGPVGQLELAWNRADPVSAFSRLGVCPVVIICHPHPVHGGTMDNKVVTTLMRTYRDLGIHAVRFNFRGVGQSEGEFDHANGELDDLMCVASWVKEQLRPSALLLAGFSFGSSIAARASYLLGPIAHLTLVAPPIERYNYDRDRCFESPISVIQGDKDERVIAEGVYRWVTELTSTVELIRYPEAGHFFHGYLTALKQDLSAVLGRQLA